MEYKNYEKKMAYFLSKYPDLKKDVKKYYQKFNYLIYKKKYRYISKYKINKISLKDKESFFGYYDKSPINIANEFIIYHSSNISTKELPRVDIPIDIVLCNKKNNTHEVIDQSYTYNWQQGTRLMWLSKYSFVYNDFDKENNRYISKIYDIRTQNFKIINFPVYDCYLDEFAISLNFDRLNICRADYGYSKRKIEIDWTNNTNDGLFYIDFKKNTVKLIVILKDIIKLNYKDTMQNAKHKFNHIMISPDGTKMMFMHRWFLEDGRRYDALYVSDVDGTDFKIVADDDMVSHSYWYNNSSIFAYLRDKEMGDQYYMIDIYNNIKTVAGDGIINKYGDGHPSINCGKVIFDTYPNKARMKELFIFDCTKNELYKLGEFFESFDYYGETRCDLHPRFSFDGKKVFFDSVHEGQRQLYIMDISKINNS